MTRQQISHMNFLQQYLNTLIFPLRSKSKLYSIFGHTQSLANLTGGGEYAETPTLFLCLDPFHYPTNSLSGPLISLLEKVTILNALQSSKGNVRGTLPHTLHNTFMEFMAPGCNSEGYLHRWFLKRNSWSSKWKWLFSGAFGCVSTCVCVLCPRQRLCVRKRRVCSFKGTLALWGFEPAALPFLRNTIAWWITVVAWYFPDLC